MTSRMRFPVSGQFICVTIVGQENGRYEAWTNFTYAGAARKNAKTPRRPKPSTFISRTGDTPEEAIAAVAAAVTLLVDARSR